ncbi:DUF805 domain-containing protein [Oricola thermophila]|uniref:DUF805 domain-containing protein n=1 Tax=Oricola thermophila TaxID=2742145 RepID=A0A6N1VEP0_9HYPH|nr:DUF805 domain-containing protein [Oricola thermophila]QKV19420.1 DUF805 domain-containing protein [Oricola thermophila]
MKAVPDHPLTVKWVLFGFKGRISRKSFWLAALLMILIHAAILSHVLTLPNNSAALALWVLLMAVAWLATAWVLLALSVKRLHDLGMPGILSICLLIPPITYIGFLLLAFLPSKQETNQHGPPPFPKP